MNTCMNERVRDQPVVSSPRDDAPPPYVPSESTQRRSEAGSRTVDDRIPISPPLSAHFSYFRRQGILDALGAEQDIERGQLPTYEEAALEAQRGRTEAPQEELPLKPTCGRTTTVRAFIILSIVFGLLFAGIFQIGKTQT